MRNGSNSIYLIAALMLLILGLSGISDKLNPASIYGDDFTINSITTTQVISNDADLNSANFIVSATANGGGQSIVGTFDGSEFKQYSGYDVTYPLQININNVKEVFTYAIRNDGNPLYRMRSVKVNRPSYWTGATCPSQASDGYFQCYLITDTPDQSGLGNDAIVKVYRDTVGSTGSFDNPGITWDGDITMTVEGTPITKKFSSATQQSVEFSYNGQWKGTAKWTGSLISGNPTPNQNLYKAVFLKTNNQWKVSQTRYYDDYRNAIFSPKATGWDGMNSYVSENDISSAVTSYNSKLDALTSQNDKISYTGATGTTFTQTTGGTEQDGNIISEGQFAIGYPVFQFIVRAKSLGVLIPVGKPEIISVSAPTFSSGDNTGAVTVTFKNAGTVKASFSASLSVNSPFYQQGTPTPISVSPGATGTITLQIGYGSAGSGTVSGTVKVYDSNKPSNYAEQSFTTEMTAPKSCIAGSFDTRGNLVYKCKQDGSGYELFLQCNSAPVFEGNTYKCNAPIDGGNNGDDSGNGGSYEATLKDWTENPFVLLLGFLVAGLVITIIRSKNTK